MNSHPNATVATVSGGVGTLAVWLLNKYAGTDLNAADGAAIAGGFAAVMLFIGRDGLVGSVKRLLWGNRDPESGVE